MISQRMCEGLSKHFAHIQQQKTDRTSTPHIPHLVDYTQICLTPHLVDAVEFAHKSSPISDFASGTWHST